MIGYRKKSFFQAHALFAKIRKNLDDLKALRELQIHLAREIIRTERAIRALKAETNSATIDERRRSFLPRRIQGHRFSAYIWRSFGDAVALTYLDKFALKDTYYRTGQKRPKADAGFLSGKDGLQHELGLLFSALDHNVPAILTDLTNTIRHGDICLMGASDPYLMEVKAAPSRNPRARKQKDSLDILRNFYETDASSQLWGNPDLRREALTDPEVSYSSQLNECIDAALRTGFASVSPENGLTYYVVRSDTKVPDPVAQFRDARAPWVFIWNDPLERLSWMPYLPPTASIVNPEHLWAMLRGIISIAIVVDMVGLEEIVAELGFEGRFDPQEPSHPLLISFGSNAGCMWISQDMLGRVGMECVSPRWLVKNSIDTFLRASSKIPVVAEGSLESHGLQMMDEETIRDFVRMGLPEGMQIAIRKRGSESSSAGRIKS
ncbi:hypothetical protein [Rhizobium sp. B21/90]|uniref:hypothetical protein n=1 Tax=Rhizobium sp. B21/90 TaxID=2819993 RepID=UPI001C5B0E26|nr:hypothetical protein [Rhizobium sp. B21/90]QYA04554.1 hypothetical protein J5278_20575 [Rhizobium sp. B21/90]